MSEAKRPAAVLLHHDMLLYQQLMTLVQEKRLVFFAGLPGSGKSLWLHQLTHLAVASGRSVHLLQWEDVQGFIQAVEQDYPDGQALQRALAAWYVV